MSNKVSQKELKGKENIENKGLDEYEKKKEARTLFIYAVRSETVIQTF